MKKKKSLFIIICIFVFTTILSNILSSVAFAPKEWIEAKDKVNEYLTKHYNEKFKYEAPKKTLDVKGDGRTTNGFYIKTKSKKYPGIGIFTNYIDDDGTIRECWQSVKYAYLLEKNLKNTIKYPHKLEINSLIWEDSSSTIYDNLEDYYNSGVNEKTRIYIYIEEKNINSDIKNVLETVVNNTPKNMKGEILLQAVNWHYSAHSFHSIPSRYILDNWDNIKVNFSTRDIDWNNIEANHENDNCIINALN